MMAKIIGLGGYLPKRIITNYELEQTLDTSDEWIRSRTGIGQRHIAAAGEYTSDLAYQAARLAIIDADIDPQTIDLIIVATNTPDCSFPSTANKLQGSLGLVNIPSFDLQAICSGFIYAMQVADNMIKSGKYKTVLVVGADKMSSLLDWEDRKTCILFGDGAGAAILQYSDSDNGIIDSNIYSDGSLFDILYTNGGVSSNGLSGTIQMQGQEVFKKAIEKMVQSVQEILAANKLTTKDINYLIPHQANLRIINSIATKCGIDEDKVVITIEKHANCSAASIPLALNELKAGKNLSKGDLLVLTAFGAGTTWGAMLIKW